MQALPECLELTHSLDNFVLGNNPQHIMKTSEIKANWRVGTAHSDRERLPPRTQR